MAEALVYLSLGSNIGDRAENLQMAIGKLPDAGLEVLRVSKFYETEPVDFLKQDWFLNCVVEGHSALPPAQLLGNLRKLEAAIGTEKTIPNGPRRIDIDILLYDQEIIIAPDLQIPHPRMNQRKFVLVPLAELAPDLEHPVAKKTISSLFAETSDQSAVRGAAEEKS